MNNLLSSHLEKITSNHLTEEITEFYATVYYFKNSVKSIFIAFIVSAVRALQCENYGNLPSRFFFAEISWKQRIY